MIKTPVSYDDRFSRIEDADGGVIFYDVSEFIGYEIVKRINMHGELVKALSMMTDIASQVDGWESFPSYAIADAESVLEKCK